MSGNKYLGLLLCLSLVACGGGGGDTPTAGTSNPTTPTTSSTAKSVSGVAAYGAALANADITIKGANGKTVVAKADANGKWTVADVSSLTVPLIIQAKGSVAGVTQELYSVLTSAPTGPVTANVTPLTTALLSQAAGVTPAALFADPAKIAAVNPAKVEAAKAKLITALSDYMAALGVDASKVDLISTTFEANSKGLDKLMDLVKVSASGTGDATAIVIKDHGTGATVEFKSSEKPAALPKPSADVLDLNLGAIRSRIAEYNALLKTKDGVMSPAILDYFDDALLDEGQNKAAVIAAIRQDYTDNPNIAYQGSLVEIKGCKQKVCTVTVSWKDAKGNTDLSDEAVRQGSDGKWRFYGDQLAQKTWPVTSYTVYGFDGSSKLNSVFSKAENYGTLTIGGKTISLWNTGSGNLMVTGWDGQWAHKVDYRAVMLCGPAGNGVDPTETGKFVLLGNTTQNATFEELKGKAFEHNEGCGADISSVSINSNSQIVFGNGHAASAEQSATAFSPAGLDTGDEVIYLKAFKVFYPDGKYWYMVVERSEVKADPAKSYIAWWKETADQ